jgi:hypothetical protein
LPRRTWSTFAYEPSTSIPFSSAGVPAGSARHYSLHSRWSTRCLPRIRRDNSSRRARTYDTYRVQSVCPDIQLGTWCADEFDVHTERERDGDGLRPKTQPRRFQSSKGAQSSISASVIIASTQEQVMRGPTTGSGTDAKPVGITVEEKRKRGE